MSGEVLSCLSCRVNFFTLDLQRNHYKSEWHRYNLKRSLAKLAPVTLEAYTELEALQAHKQKLLEEQEKKRVFYCDCCCKQFGSERAYSQHNESKRHEEMKRKKSKEEAVQLDSKETNGASAPTGALKSQLEKNDLDEDDDEYEDVEEIEGEPIPPTSCLFCSQSSDSVVDNLKHMSVAHSFFIPDAEYLTDCEGLLEFLGEKVGCGFICLWCGNSKTFWSLRAVQQHMCDKGHCKIKYEMGESVIEYSDFYDYSKSYPDGEEADSEEEVDVDVITQNDEWQLVLPSGSVIGHRSLFRYYRQNLKPVDPRRPQQRKSVLEKMMSNYRALGWTGTTGAAAVQRARDVHFYQRFKSRQALKVMQKHNRVLQPHFRSSTGF